jgi:hypothetical protein
VIAGVTLVISEEALIPNTFGYGVSVRAEANCRLAFAAEPTDPVFLVTEEDLMAWL